MLKSWHLRVEFLHLLMKVEQNSAKENGKMSKKMGFFGNKTDTWCSVWVCLQKWHTVIILSWIEMESSYKIEIFTRMVEPIWLKLSLMIKESLHFDTIISIFWFHELFEMGSSYKIEIFTGTVERILLKLSLMIKESIHFDTIISIFDFTNCLLANLSECKDAFLLGLTV